MSKIAKDARRPSRRGRRRGKGLLVATRAVHDDVFRRLCRARELIHDVCDAPLQLSDMARAANLSPYHFLRCYKQVFRETPHRSLVRARIARAKAELARGATVTDACFAAGFSSLGSFSTLFSREVGVSPSAWRRTVRALSQVPGGIARIWVPFCFAERFARRD